MCGLAYAKPEEIGLDAARLQVAYDLLDRWTAGPDFLIPGVAIAIGRHGRVVEPRFFGRQGPEDDEPIRRDGAFLLASITKPVTYMAAMLLAERGQLSLADPVTEYLPEFASHHKEQTLLFHLFTHTSGLPDMLPNNLELRRQHAPLSRFVEATMHDVVPLFPPGTNLSYQSMGTLITAAIVEQIAGQPLPAFLEREVFSPLGMSSTSLGSGRLDPARLVRVRMPPEQAGTDFGWNSDYWRKLGSPWGGLFSTPDDFAAICQLMLGGGRLGDVSLLSSATVERMTTNRLHDLPELSEPLRRTQPWGLGWKINRSASADVFSDLLSSSAYGHWGATGTVCWIDPRRQGFCLLFATAPMSDSRRRLVRISNAVAASFT
ncbi:MAG TPA: serine hydrolase domain-containing protein [Pirellulales bacterium]|jgi:CubicO group peptidase (beta-lactamase class C family)|nr:serine hydrolase domain-containing protein [Pirellulales bacterium]